ncbi:MAG: hypothetical protein WA144_15430 [Candidatus Methanoperedens sp.]
MVLTVSPEEIYQEMKCTKALMQHVDDKLRVIRDAQIEKDKSYETKLAQEIVIPANSSKTTVPVNNDGYNRCRIELVAMFTEENSGSIGVSMVYGNSPIAQINDIISSNGASTYISEPIDINHLGGFQFQLLNRDTSNSATVRNIKIIFYNE